MQKQYSDRSVTRDRSPHGSVSAYCLFYVGFEKEWESTFLFRQIYTPVRQQLMASEL
jgi:hypothetical protein